MVIAMRTLSLWFLCGNVAREGSPNIFRAVPGKYQQQNEKTTQVLTANRQDDNNIIYLQKVVSSQKNEWRL